MPYATNGCLPAATGVSPGLREADFVAKRLADLRHQRGQLPRAARKTFAHAGGGCGCLHESGAVPGPLFGTPAVTEAAGFLGGIQGAVVEIGGVGGDQFGAMGPGVVDDPASRAE